MGITGNDVLNGLHSKWRQIMLVVKQALIRVNLILILQELMDYGSKL